MQRTSLTTNHKNIEEKNFLGLKKYHADLLIKLNQQFLTQHGKTARVALQSIESIIILKDAHLSLYVKNNIENTYKKLADSMVTPQNGPYTQLKEISHIPLLILEILHDSNMPDANKIEQLTLLYENVSEINKDIKNDNETLKYQKEILSISTTFLQKIKELNGQIKKDIPTLIVEYMQQLNNALEYNRTLVTSIQCNALNDLIKQWINLYALNLTTSRVMIVAPHGPRDGLIEMQYFIQLFHNMGIQQPENDRIYFVEELPEHFNLININQDLIESFLAISERNKVIGLVVKHDEKFMFKDILADKAPAALQELLPSMPSIPTLGTLFNPLQCPMLKAQILGNTFASQNASHVPSYNPGQTLKFG